MQRLQTAQTIPQKDHAQLLDSEIKQMAKEWEGNPEEKQFWDKFAENPDAEKGRKETLRGMQVLNKQGGVLGRQDSVFKQLLTDRDSGSNNGEGFYRGNSMMGSVRDGSGNRALVHRDGAGRESH